MCEEKMTGALPPELGGEQPPNAEFDSGTERKVLYVHDESSFSEIRDDNFTESLCFSFPGCSLENLGDFSISGCDRGYQIDPVAAPFVLEAYKRYDEGSTMKEIRDWVSPAADFIFNLLDKR